MAVFSFFCVILSVRSAAMHLKNALNNKKTAHFQHHHKTLNEFINSNNKDMKTTIKMLPLIMLLFTFVACQSDTSKQATKKTEITKKADAKSNSNAAANNKAAADKSTSTKQSYDLLDIASAKIQSNKSNIYWTGTKPVGDAHKGYFTVKSGEITFANGEINGGEFVIDVAGVKVSDIKEPKPNADLVGHLKSPDFFDTDKYPEGKFKITKVELAKDVTGAVGGFSHFVTGDLSLKDATQSVRFGVNVFTKDNSIQVRSRPFKIDRTQWNVKYNSGKFFDNIKEKLIDDNVIIKLDIHASY